MTGSKQSPAPITMADLGSALPKKEPLEGGGAGGNDADEGTKGAKAAEAAAFLESLPPKVRARVTALDGLQEDHDKLEEQYEREKAELVAKFSKLYEPLYERRASIVAGKEDPAAASKEGGDGGGAADGTGEDSVGIPEFWLTALKASEMIQELITERDEGALRYLADIKSHSLEGSKGFKLDFHFSTNPYFKNAVITKTYYMVDDEEPILERAEGTEIQWNSGKNLTQKILKKKPKKGASKSAKPVTKVEACDSFFTFFSPPQIPADDDDIDEDEVEELQSKMEFDYEIAAKLKNNIIPRAVRWFKGEAADDEDDEDYDYDEEDGDGDDDEDDDEDADEDEDEDDDDDKAPRAAKARRGGGGRGGRKAVGEEGKEEDEGKGGGGEKKPLLKKPGGVGGKAEEPAECKQQ